MINQQKKTVKILVLDGLLPMNLNYPKVIGVTNDEPQEPTPPQKNATEKSLVSDYLTIIRWKNVLSSFT